MSLVTRSVFPAVEGSRNVALNLLEIDFDSAQSYTKKSFETIFSELGFFFSGFFRCAFLFFLFAFQQNFRSDRTNQFVPGNQLLDI